MSLTFSNLNFDFPQMEPSSWVELCPTRLRYPWRPGRDWRRDGASYPAEITSLSPASSQLSGGPSVSWQLGSSSSSWWSSSTCCMKSWGERTPPCPRLLTLLIVYNGAHLPQNNIFISVMLLFIHCIALLIFPERSCSIINIYIVVPRSVVLNLCITDPAR